MFKPITPPLLLPHLFFLLYQVVANILQGDTPDKEFQDILTLSIIPSKSSNPNPTNP